MIHSWARVALLLSLCVVGNTYNSVKTGVSWHTTNLPVGRDSFLWGQTHSSDGTDSSHSAIVSIASALTVEGDTKKTLLNLIEYGERWVNNQKEVANSLETSEVIGKSGVNSYEKVFGCMATVMVKTSLTSTRTVRIEGYADSLVAQGMLAVIVQGFETLAADEVLAVSPQSLSEKCGFSKLLPSGRLNGFVNMVTLVQTQLRKLVNSDSIAINSSTEDNSPSLRDSRQDEVAVLLSGGVDSSVALKLLLLQGYKVRAYYLKIWLEDEVAHLNECPWEEDLTYATQVCDQLNVPLEAISLQKEYWNEVVQYTFEEARLGRTPNPDIMCNSRIKFGMFYKYIGRFHPKIATGHYAQVAKVHKLSNGQTEIVPAFSYDVEKVREFLSKDAEHKKTFSQQMIKDSLSSVDEVMLVRAPDPIKDQSYFLSNLNQEQLRRCLFPIGHLQKYEVRELADLFNLPTKARKDSQGICFLGKLKFDEFISHYLGENRGPIKCYRTGEVLGEHKGLWFHTIGQRKGIGLLLKPRTVHSGPWYVVAKDPSTNTIYLTNQLELVEQPRIRFQVEDVNWISGSPPKEISNPDGMVIDMKLRHGPTISTGKIRPSKSSTTGSDDKTLKYDVFLNKKDKGIAPGQFAAFYIGNRCLGAGVIANTDHAVVSDSTVNIDTVDVELSTERIVIDVEQNSNNTPTAVCEFIGDE